MSQDPLLVTYLTKMVFIMQNKKNHSFITVVTEQKDSCILGFYMEGLKGD